MNEEKENDIATKKNARESSSTQEPSKRVETNSVRPGKWARISKNLVKCLSKVASILGREIRAASSEISQAVGFDVELSEKRSKFF